jgi:hypothetical protein
MIADMSEKSSVALHWEIDFKWGKRLHAECWTRKEGSESGWLLDGVWKFKGITKKADTGSRPLCLYEGDVKYDWTVQELKIEEQNF